MNRSAGILLPIFSLPSRYGIGCFDQAAYDFVDWLADAGQTYWQILPLAPTSYGPSSDSPYQSYSAFAGNPYFISLEALIEEGVLTKEECDAVDFGTKAHDVDYDKLHEHRFKLLHLAYERSDISKNPDYLKFVEENHWWLADYALFMAVKTFFKETGWCTWPEDIRLHWGFALDYYRETLYFDVEFQQYLQYQFFKQWRALKTYANDKGIQIVGDIPIYVSMDSADVWAHPELFQLDDQNMPTAVAGCPPDSFSATGQLWGNPLYRWDYHKNTGYEWWITRIWHSFQLYDVVRIDHFRGFDEYYAIPYGSETAMNGHWEPGPGLELFSCMEEKLGWHPVIAEDLGLITDSVRKLVRDTHFPNMKVIQFAFETYDRNAQNEYLPHNFGENCVVYTGTHDNETLVGWLEGMDPELKKVIRGYLCDEYTPDKKLYRSVLALTLRSNAHTCIVPIQDYLGLDNSCRTNQPSTVKKNWRWRLKPGEVTKALGRDVFDLTRRFGRLSEKAR